MDKTPELRAAERAEQQYSQNRLFGLLLFVVGAAVIWITTNNALSWIGLAVAGFGLLMLLDAVFRLRDARARIRELDR